MSVTETGTATLEQVRELSIHQLRTLFEHMTDNDLGVIERAIRIMTDAAAAAAPAAVGALPEAIGASR